MLTCKSCKHCRQVEVLVRDIEDWDARSGYRCDGWSIELPNRAIDGDKQAGYCSKRLFKVNNV